MQVVLVLFLVAADAAAQSDGAVAGWGVMATVAGTGVALLAVLVPLLLALRSDLRERIDAFRGAVDRRFGEVDRRFGEVGERIDTLRVNVDHRIGDMGERIGELRADMGDVRTILREHGERLARIEATDLANARSIGELRVDVGDVRERLARIETRSNPGAPSGASSRAAPRASA